MGMLRFWMGGGLVSCRVLTDFDGVGRVAGVGGRCCESLGLVGGCDD
jgi:hypothetical protein